MLHSYGYDAGRFFAPGDARRPEGRPFTAVFVGRCEPRKGLHHALRAGRLGRVRGRPLHHLRVVRSGLSRGDRAVARSPECRATRVRFRSFRADEGERCFPLFPSIEEGSALVTYEAQACGCVPVISEATGARCRDGVDGYVHPPGDVAMLTEQLRRLHQDPGLLAHLRTAMLARTDDLTWEAAAEELVRIYTARANSAKTSASRP